MHIGYTIFCSEERKFIHAIVVQLVVRHLAKVEFAGSSPVCRSGNNGVYAPLFFLCNSLLRSNASKVFWTFRAENEGGMIVYQIGDYIVKSTDGVCKVEDILHLNMSGVDCKKEYYLLIPVGEKAEKIYVPVDTKTNIRKAMTEEEALKLIDKIPEIEEMWVDNEKMREQRYKEAVRSGDPESLISIIKMIYLRKQKRMAQGKKTMMVDERYFQKAEQSLYSELGFALGKNKDEVCRIIEESVKRKKK